MDIQVAVRIIDIDIKKEDSKTKWINIKDASPANNQTVLVTDGVNMAVSTYYDCNDPEIPNFGGDDWEWDLRKDNITHWAELPELPKKGISK